MSPRACPYSKTVNEFLMFETMAAGMATIEPTPTMIVPFLNKGMRSHLITAKAKEIDFTITNSSLDMNLAANMDPVKARATWKRSAA